MNCKPYETITDTFLAAFAFTACLDTSPKILPRRPPGIRTRRNSRRRWPPFTILRNCYSTYLSVSSPRARRRVFLEGSTPNSTKFYYHNYDTGNNSVKEVWRGLYKGIDNANVLLENADNAACALK